MEAILIRGGTIDINKWGNIAWWGKYPDLVNVTWREFDQSHARISRWGITTLIGAQLGYKSRPHCTGQNLT